MCKFAIPLIFLFASVACVPVANEGGSTSGEEAMQEEAMQEESGVAEMGEASFPVTVVDEGGTEYTFDEAVERIICLSATCIDDMFVLGMQPLAVSDVFSLIYRQVYGDTAEDLPIVPTNGGFQPDIEQIIDLEPEVVMAQIGIMDAIREPLEATGNMKVLLSYTNSVDEVKQGLRDIAAMVGNPAPAEAAIEDFEATMAELQSKITEPAPLMIVFGPSGSDTMYLETTDAQTCNTLELYGLADCLFDLPENAGAFGAFGFAEFTYEAILAEDPENVFFGGYDEGGEIVPEILEQVNANPLWQALSAVQNEQIYPIEAWKYSGSSGITVLEIGITEAVATLYPDVFGE
ncbi:MAG: ABC transporter substrate-binding protein [Chloroflexota bacterium]